jgi:Tol biopolymer transport system component
VDTGERTALTIVEDASLFQRSPDGTRMLFYQEGALSIAGADGSGVVAIDVQGGPEWIRAQWLPDGTRVVYQERLTTGNDVGNLFVHEIATGRRTQVTHLDPTFADWFWLWPSFSPDGQNVVFHLARDAGSEPGFDVWSVPVTGGDPELLVEDAAWPRYLPDGRLVYVASPRTMHDGDTLVIAAADGSTRTLAEAVDGIRRVNVSPGGARVMYVTGDPDDVPADDQVYVVAVESGEASMIEEGEWVDDHTLLVGPCQLISVSERE